MSGRIRSKQGCWTCKLRKKKCDERRPNCSACESLTITCHGFGPKPDWMDNGQRERDVTNSLKEVVKSVSRRKVTQQTNERGQVIKIAPRPENVTGKDSGSSSSEAASRQEQTITSPSDHRLSEDNGVSILEDKSIDSQSSRFDPYPAHRSITSIPANESVLLMHFLDTVFSLQYPMYKPDIEEGGRGWLLTLLLRNPPLYHGALTLSAFHRRTSRNASLTHVHKTSLLGEQEKHLEICMKWVKLFAQNDCPKNGLGVLNSVIQLVFYELSGDSNAWKAHLGAAINMYQQGHRERLGYFGLTEESKTIIFAGISLSEASGLDPTVFEEVTIFRFLSSVVIWLDIMYSISTGKTPEILPYHFCIISSTSKTRLENVMGCQNWVMLQISRVTALHVYKTKGLREGYFNSTEFEQTALDIRGEIDNGLCAGTTTSTVPSSGYESYDLAPCGTKAESRTLVTSIFIHMASIYLHLVVHGFRELDLLDAELSIVMRKLQTEITPNILPALVAPLFVIGSVARAADEQTFQAALSSLYLLDPLFPHRRRLLPLLVDIWGRRRNTAEFLWIHVLDLIKDLLLI